MVGFLGLDYGYLESLQFLSRTARILKALLFLKLKASQEMQEEPHAIHFRSAEFPLEVKMVEQRFAVHNFRIETIGNPLEFTLTVCLYIRQ